MAINLFRKKAITPRQQHLRALSLFVNLSFSEIVIVDDLLHEREFIKDEVIFDEGEEGQAIYLILEGNVLICRHGSPVEGRIAELGAGDFFGDLALLDNSPRVAQARAATHCILAVFFRADFMSLLETHSLIASKILLQLSRHIGLRLREATLGLRGEPHL